MVYDCFTYWNEDELIQLRLKHLWNFVDRFVIVESNITHRGNSKDWNLEKLLSDELSWAKEKIIYIKKEIDVSNFNVTHQSVEYDLGSPFWAIENLQRNAISEGLKDASPDDIIMIGDLDEFPNHSTMGYLHEITDRFEKFSLGMRIFNYYLNVEQYFNNPIKAWIGTVIGKFKNLDSPQAWRTQRHYLPWQGNMGYHFTWLGEEEVYQKFKNTSHDEIESFGTSENIKRCFHPDSEGNFDDIFGRGVLSRVIDIANDPNYPTSILENLKISRFMYTDVSSSPKNPVYEFTIVIPTIWSSEKIYESVALLNSSYAVGEIIIINNRPEACKRKIEGEKVREFVFEKNLYVNPSWNFGVSQAKFDKICILNDDVILEDMILHFMTRCLDESPVGLVGLSKSCYDLSDAHKDHRERNWHLEQIAVRNRGFGCALFIKKENYVPIPDDLKIWFGDDWLVKKLDGKVFRLHGGKIWADMSQSVDNPAFKQIVDQDVQNSLKYQLPWSNDFD